MCITTYIYIYIYIYQVAGLRGGLRADGVAGPVGRPHLAEAVLGGRYIYIYIYIYTYVYICSLQTYPCVYCTTCALNPILCSPIPSYAVLHCTVL